MAYIKLLTFFFLCLLFSSKCYSQKNTVTISGFVRDKTSGEVLIGTNVLLYKDSINTNNDFLHGTSTNAYGFYAIPKISRGIYYLVFGNIGFHPFIHQVDVKETTQIRVDVELEVKEISLDEVVINQKKAIT